MGTPHLSSSREKRSQVPRNLGRDYRGRRRGVSARRLIKSSKVSRRSKRGNYGSRPSCPSRRDRLPDLHRSEILIEPAKRVADQVVEQRHVSTVVDHETLAVGRSAKQREERSRGRLEREDEVVAAAD